MGSPTPPQLDFPTQSFLVSANPCLEEQGENKYSCYRTDIKMIKEVVLIPPSFSLISWRNTWLLAELCNTYVL